MERGFCLLKATIVDCTEMNLTGSRSGQGHLTIGKFNNIYMFIIKHSQKSAWILINIVHPLINVVHRLINIAHRLINAGHRVRV